MCPQLQEVFLMCSNHILFLMILLYLVHSNHKEGMGEQKGTKETTFRVAHKIHRLVMLIFKPFNGLTKQQKLSIVGRLVGQSPRIYKDDIYQCMIDMHDNNKKITIKHLSELLNVSNRTIYRHMCQDLKKEKELLNQQL